jgi:thiosulfate dehydrogenase (quinone) large subunit
LLADRHPARALSTTSGSLARPWPAAAALMPLRGFLGVTFVYAGIQKLSDPGFLHPGAGTYIGTQLRGFAHGTPGGWVLRTFAIPHPQLAGVGVAVVEILVGLLVLVGLGTRPAATVGLALNGLLFLTNSWHASPYFLGSDIVFVFAWLPLLLAGTAGQPALEHALRARSRRPRGSGAAPALTRREALARAYAAVGAGALTLAGLSYLARGSYQGKALARLGGAAGRRSPTPSPGRAAGGALPRGAVRLGGASRLPAGQAAIYHDPVDGNPDIVVHLPSGELAACSAICTHAGCQVGYAQGALVCPCHGSVFNARTGAVEQGPATQPLARKRVVRRGGELYALPT